MALFKTALPRRRSLLLISVGILVLAGALLLFSRREPSYAGRDLSEWVAELGVSSPADPNLKPIEPEKISRATNAVFHIGTNACPYLLKCIRYRRPAWKETLFLIGNRLLSKLPGRVRLWDKEELQAYNAAAAFGHISQVDDSILRELDALKHGPDRGRSERASMAIEGQARCSLRALLMTLSSPSTHSRFSPFQSPSAFRSDELLLVPSATQARVSAIQRVWQFRTNAVTAISVLVACLDDSEPRVASMAAGMLGRLHLEPRLAIPALTNALRNPAPIVRMQAVSALSRFGRDAIPALPALYDARNDPDSDVASRATNSVLEIESHIKNGATPPE